MDFRFLVEHVLLLRFPRWAAMLLLLYTISFYIMCVASLVVVRFSEIFVFTKKHNILQEKIGWSVYFDSRAHWHVTIKSLEEIDECVRGATVTKTSSGVEKWLRDLCERWRAHMTEVLECFSFNCSYRHNSLFPKMCPLGLGLRWGHGC